MDNFNLFDNLLRLATAQRSRYAKLKQARLALVLLLCLTAAPAEAAQDYKKETKNYLSPIEFHCFDYIISKESKWNFKAQSPTHDYGAVQRHMTNTSRTTIRKWLNNPQQQITWAINYMRTRYGSICQAATFHQQHNWY